MISSRIAVVSLILAAPLLLCLPPGARGQAGARDQDDPTQTKPKVLSLGGAGATIQSINDDYNRQLLELERQRLERLRQLAARQSPQDADGTYESLFRLAIARNLFREAEPSAQEALKSSNRSPVVLFLAQTIDVIASADKGAYDESLAELRRLLTAVSQHRPAGASSAPALDTSSLLLICEAYYQRLLQGDRFDAARTAFRSVLAESENPAIRAFCASRLNQLDMIGKPAPAISGTDIDGKPVSLAHLKGNVVLVVFWASWCMPSSAEVAWLDEVYSANEKRGFRVLGVSVDNLQSGGPKLETAMPYIRRFLLDHNIRWPNLLNGAGSLDVAKAYGVIEIPANVLIGRDGTVIHRDLSRKNLGAVVARAVNP
jgi:peroxiredoxin